jgi:hypothetical protein
VNEPPEVDREVPGAKEAAITALATLLDRIDSGEVDGTDLQRAHLATALDSLQRPTSAPRPEPTNSMP